MNAIRGLLRRAHEEAWDPWSLAFEGDREQWRERLSEVQRGYLRDLLYSQLYGEYEVLEGVTRLARLSREEDVRLFLLTHARDNAVHADVFERYLHDVAGSGPLRPEELKLKLPKAYVALIAEEPRRLLSRLEASYNEAELAELLAIYYLLADGILYNTSYEGLRQTVWARGWLQELRRAYELISRDEKRQTLFGAHYMKRLASASQDALAAIEGALSNYSGHVIATIGHFSPLIESFGLTLQHFIDVSREVVAEELQILGLRP
ncbi:MAG: hypothetical protein C4339_04380 [Nitrososphaerota archaeon]